MKKITRLLPLLIVALSLSTGLRGQNLQVVTEPQMDNRTDSLSYFIGLIAGLDISGDLESINPELVAHGVFYGYIKNYDKVMDMASDRVAEYLSIIHNDEVAASRERLKSLPDSDPYWVRRETAIYDPEGMTRQLTSRRIERGEDFEGGLPDMATLEDSISFYRGIAEGRYIARWLDEIEFYYAVEGVVHAFLLGSDGREYEEIYDYLSRNLYDIDDDYYGNYSPFTRGDKIEMPEGVEVPDLVNIADSVAYFFGVYLGGNVKQEAEELPLDLIIKGLVEGHTLDKDIPEDNIQRLITFYFDHYLPEERLAVAMEKARVVMDSVAALPGFITSETGLVYRIVQDGDMSRRVTGLDDNVILDYEVSSLDGERVYTSREYGNPSLGDVMEGFYEGLQMIGVGGKIDMYIPPTLTNDADGYRNDYGGRVFYATATLRDIEPDEATIRRQYLEVSLEEARAVMDSVAALPGFETSETGLVYRIEYQGDMSQRVVGLYDDVRLDYQVTSLDGSRQYSSDYFSNPNLGDTLEGFYQGLKMIGVGGKIEMYIPPTLTDDADGYQNDYGGRVFYATVTLLEVVNYDD